MDSTVTDYNFDQSLQIEHIATADVQVLDTAVRPVEDSNENYLNLVEDLKRGNPIHTPIFVKKLTDLATGIQTYELIDGLHRLTASKAVGRDQIPAIVYPEDTPRAVTLGLQLRSNALRIAQKPVQEAKQYERIMAEVPGITVKELAKLVGRSEAIVRDRLKFTPEKLEQKIITLVEEGTITADNARELAKAGKSLQTDDAIQAAMTLKPAELKERLDSTKKALHSGETEPAKPKEEKKFEAKFKFRDRAIVETEIASGDLAKAKFDKPAQQAAFKEALLWVSSQDEDTVTLAREEFDRKQAAAEDLKKEKELSKKKQKYEELKKDLEITVPEVEAAV